MLGFIMLVGTVVNNPILIVEQSLVHWREDGLPIGEAVIESVRTRIRPIFMTTLGGLVGLLPLVLAPGAGSELYRGIGAVLLGGLLVSTVVTLVFVPGAAQPDDGSSVSYYSQCPRPQLGRQRSRLLTKSYPEADVVRADRLKIG